MTAKKPTDEHARMAQIGTMRSHAQAMATSQIRSSQRQRNRIPAIVQEIP